MNVESRVEGISWLVAGLGSFSAKPTASGRGRPRPSLALYWPFMVFFRFQSLLNVIEEERRKIFTSKHWLPELHRFDIICPCPPCKSVQNPVLAPPVVVRGRITFFGLLRLALPTPLSPLFRFQLIENIIIICFDLKNGLGSLFVARIGAALKQHFRKISK